MKNVSLADGWCEGRAILNLTNYLVTRNGGNSFPWDLFVRTLNTLRFELYSPQSYALIASVSLSVTVQDCTLPRNLTSPDTYRTSASPLHFLSTCPRTDTVTLTLRLRALIVIHHIIVLLCAHDQ